MRTFRLSALFILLAMIIGVVLWGGQAFAGNIDPDNDGSAFAYGENVGWLNLNPTGSGVSVFDSELDGYAWGENVGWISFNCLSTATCLDVNYKVMNDGAGNLSGYAWGENVGWINFAPTGGGVIINPGTGIFSGMAWGENIGWISFNSTGPVAFQVKTSWRGNQTQEFRVDGAVLDDQRYPWADYNEATSEYLVLWQDKRNGTDDDIYGVRLNVGGNRIGPDFPVSIANGHQQRVVVKAGGGGYLAVWHDLRNQATNGADIFGAWIAGDGTVGPEMAICDCSSDQWNPVASYDPDSQTFLVVWLDGRGSVNNQGSNPNDDYDLYGVVIPVGGSQSLPTPFSLVSANNGQRGPQIGYDYGNSQYYLAWNDRRSGVNYDIYGSRVTPPGAPLDGLDGTGVLLSGASGNQFRPTVTDRRPSAGINNHLVTWTDFRDVSQGDVYGIYVDGSGMPVGSEIPVSASPADQANMVADVDWINTKKFLVGFIDNTPGAFYNINTASVDQSGLSVEHGPIAANVDEQRAEVVTYATDGITDRGFLVVWMDRRNGTDYDIWGIKIWP